MSARPPVNAHRARNKPSLSRRNSSSRSIAGPEASSIPASRSITSIFVGIDRRVRQPIRLRGTRAPSFITHTHQGNLYGYPPMDGYRIGEAAKLLGVRV